MKFTKIPAKGNVAPAGKSVAYLQVDNWNDYSFVTMFYLYVHDERGELQDIGSVKIAFKGQDADTTTHSTFPDHFPKLSDAYFSLGQDADYYKNIRGKLSKELSDSILSGLNDLAYTGKNPKKLQSEQVFTTSLLRSVSLTAIEGQYRRVLDGAAPLSNFKFVYDRPQEEKFAGVELSFSVAAESKPSTNIHAIIGRNGSGKTTLLNGMIESIVGPEEKNSYFFDTSGIRRRPISRDYFSSLVSVAFSAFDPFSPPQEQSDPSMGTCYYYIGLKNITSDATSALKELPMLREEFCSSIAICMSQPEKRRRWLNAINALESDANFAEMHLQSLGHKFKTGQLEKTALELIRKMSSGHTIVLLTVTKLVATVEEKTLVIIDEPESHLHPPLLGAFLRALSELLFDRNGVAIIATHSPVVLQEIPKSCVWKLTRARLSMSGSRPGLQTFGENVGVLTHEAFGLEVTKSGFYTLLQAAVDEGETFDDIMYEYDEQLGFEAQATLRAMILNRDNQAVKNEKA